MIELGSNKKSASNYTEAKYKQTKQSTIKTRQGIVCSLLDVCLWYLFEGTKVTKKVLLDFFSQKLDQRGMKIS